MFTPQAVGGPPGPELSPATVTYGTAASTPVTATTASAQVVHEDVKELAQDLRVVMDGEAVDRVEHDKGAAFRILAQEELDLQHDVLEHRRTLDGDRVRMALRLGHHDLADAVHEPDVLHRNFEGLHRVQDALARDRRRHVDDLEVFLRREPVDQALDRVEILSRPPATRDGLPDRP